MVITVAVSIAAGLAVVALANALWPPLQADNSSAVSAGSAGHEGSSTREDPDTGADGRTDPGPIVDANHRLLAVVFGAAAASGLHYPRGLGAWAARHGVGIRVSAQDLAISGFDHDNVLTAKILTTCASSLTASGGGIVLNRVWGLALPGVGVVALALLFGAATYFLPDAFVRRQARARRREFERALPVWCDLVALEMAGTAAPQEALVTAAEAGTTWPMQVVRDTLYRAVTAREPHWPALSALGERIGVDDLAQLGRLSQLVSHEGAQVRDTLIERAEGMRRRFLAASLGQAGQRDESMRLAVLVIAAGVILLLLYPGVIAVTQL
ncbi:hypothetical protein [Kineosporia babensis]|uniref:Type II secretion system protein GspF domain-containing protein n=1 Tax=Kineosporia babensis TaxID=499548 RepID=A0A9X1NN91_9ACTN|nr:hypothetical protein [Kineosporia babensis]MCD5316846.1 hypothetical protein [Kineosporia babensis]